MDTLLFERVAIIGPGLIGGSLGMALRAERLAGAVVGVGHRQGSLDRALAVGAVDETTLDPCDAVADADLVVLATSVGKIIEGIALLAPCMKPGAILTDVGSVKGAVCAAARETLGRSVNPGVRFVGSHPLAGSERRGIKAARGDLFQGAICILTPQPETDPDGAALTALRRMWEAVGCDVRELPPDDHDRLLAEISHLPHAVAAALVNAVSDDALALAATGFMDTTRVASGDPGLWVDICVANRESLMAAFRVMQGRLGELADAVEARDAAGLSELLSTAKTRRDRCAKGRLS